MTTTLTLDAGVLEKITDAVVPASAGGSPFEPTHFTESMIIYPSTSHDGAMEFCCTDGFKSFTVQLFDTTWDDPEDKTDRIVVGAEWLRKVAATEHTAPVTFGADKLPGDKLGEVWQTCDATQDGVVLEKGQKFNLGGRWPDVRSLVHHDTVEYGENGVGLHPEFFKLAVDTMIEWWDQVDDPSESFPIVIRELAANKVASFSIVNSHGRLLVAIMPKVLDSDDY